MLTKIITCSLIINNSLTKSYSFVLLITNEHVPHMVLFLPSRLDKRDFELQIGTLLNYLKSTVGHGLHWYIIKLILQVPSLHYNNLTNYFIK